MPFRPGSVGALIDEYERAVHLMHSVLESVTEEEYTAQANPTTPQQEMRTIQSMMRHVVNAGYGYATYISSALGTTIQRPRVELLPLAELPAQLTAIVAFTDDVLRDRYTMPEDDMDTITMKAPWNVVYTIDQMLEHAVMHIHRHRRQLERYLEILRARSA